MKYIILFFMLSFCAFAETYECSSTTHLVKIFSIKNSASDMPGIVVTNKETDDKIVVLARDIDIDSFFDIVYFGITDHQKFYSVKIILKDIATPVGGRVDGELILEAKFLSDSINDVVSCVRGRDPV